MALFDVVEASIADLRSALEEGRASCVELVAAYLERVARYDRSGPHLNAVPVLNVEVFDEAAAADDRRAAGAVRGPLDGIPYTVKDSYAVQGQSLAAGSPAFEGLVANADAFAVERLRAAGALVLGRTTMPPMANGGMQRGLYGRAESPYNADYLTAAYASGSSNGSGTATAASFSSFGLGEETWSSGRAPASNNGLVAYTPSRGLISVRGNWPLVPTMDVVVPHTRTVADLLEVLEVLVVDDPDRSGDFWRTQPWVELPAASQVRPASYSSLAAPDALAGVRLGVPRMYVNADPGADQPIETRQSVLDLWREARFDLLSRGADVVEVDFPVVSNYERDRPGARSMVDRGIVPADFEQYEMWDLCMLWWDRFIRELGASGPRSLAEVDGPMIFPPETGVLQDRYGEPDLDLADYVTRARAGLLPLEEIPAIAAGVRGLEETRRRDFENWLTENGLDGVVFPAVADVGRSNADKNPDSHRAAWRNGTWVANGNLVPRHLGIPTVSVPMGLMADITMPVGLTFAGPAYSDSRLLGWAAAFDQQVDRRVVPPRTPRLPGSAGDGQQRPERSASAGRPELRLETTASPGDDRSSVRVDVRVEVRNEHPLELLRLSVNGRVLELDAASDGVFVGTCEVASRDHQRTYSEWSGPSGSLVVGYVRDVTGSDAGGFAWAPPLPASDAR